MKKIVLANIVFIAPLLMIPPMLSGVTPKIRKPLGPGNVMEQSSHYYGLKNPGLSTLFDSLNVCYIGNWPFGAVRAVAYDSLRKLIFIGAGGGVYILNDSIHSNPQMVSDKICTRGDIANIFYDSNTKRIFIADADGILSLIHI